MKPLTQQPWTLYGIIAVFLLPILAAFWLSKHHTPTPQTNRGFWVQPSIALESVLESTPNNDHFYWYVIHVLPKDCNDQCLKDQDQLKTILSRLGPKQPLTQLLAVHPFDESSEPFSLSAQGERLLNPGYLYLADPRQKIILSYKNNQATDLLLDLKKILKTVDQMT